MTLNTLLQIGNHEYGLSIIGLDKSARIFIEYVTLLEEKGMDITGVTTRMSVHSTTDGNYSIHLIHFKIEELRTSSKPIPNHSILTMNETIYSPTPVETDEFSSAITF